MDYRYELRRGDEIVATGHLSSDDPYELGDAVTIGLSSGVVSAVEPTLGARELRLVVQIGAAGQID